MEALGQDSERGSLYIQDSRNLFRNAAHVNTFKNYVVTEWGTATAGTADTAAAPTAEGGFFREMGAFSYGVYLGNKNDSEEAVRNGTGYAGSAIATGTANFQDYDNPIDLYFGGDMGIQWGARISYAKGEVDTGTAATKTEHSAMGLGLGIVMGDLDVYGSMKLKDESKGDGATADAKYEAGGMQLGLGYNLGDLFAVWKGGLSFHGGLAGLLTSGYIFAKRNKISWAQTMDTIALAGAPGLFFGRVGNFINGELYGRTTDSALGMIFPNAGPYPRHPSQLYEGILEGIVLTIILWVIKRRVKTYGWMAATFLVGYGVFRYIVEFFREADSQLGYYFGGTTTMGQILCFIMIILGLGTYYIVWKKKLLMENEPFTS
jgi:hypothetical protein